MTNEVDPFGSVGAGVPRRRQRHRFGFELEQRSRRDPLSRAGIHVDEAGEGEVANALEPFRLPAAAVPQALMETGLERFSLARIYTMTATSFATAQVLAGLATTAAEATAVRHVPVRAAPAAGQIRLTARDGRHPLVEAEPTEPSSEHAPGVYEVVSGVSRRPTPPAPPPLVQVRVGLPVRHPGTHEVLCRTWIAKGIPVIREELVALLAAPTLTVRL